MGLFFAPVANVVLSAVGWQEQGQASGANNAMRELGGVFGIAVLAAIFANRGSYFTAQTFMDGLTPAIWVGAVVVGDRGGRLPVHPRQAARGGGCGAGRLVRGSGWRSGRVVAAGRRSPRERRLNASS